jgi:hypothetical protein
MGKVLVDFCVIKASFTWKSTTFTNKNRRWGVPNADFSKFMIGELFAEHHAVGIGRIGLGLDSDQSGNSARNGG